VLGGGARPRAAIALRCAPASSTGRRGGAGTGARCCAWCRGPAAAGGGLALSHRAVLAGAAGRPTPAQDPPRLGATTEAAQDGAGGPGPRLVVVVDGGGAAGALALAGVTPPRGPVSRRRGEAALSPPSAPAPRHARPQPPKGPRQARLHALGRIAAIPREDRGVDGLAATGPHGGAARSPPGGPPRRAPGGHTLWLVADPAGPTAPGSRLLPRAVATPWRSWRGSSGAGPSRFPVQTPGSSSRGDAKRPGADRCHRAYPPRPVGAVSRAARLALRWRADGRFPGRGRRGLTPPRRPARTVAPWCVRLAGLPAMGCTWCGGRRRAMSTGGLGALAHWLPRAA